MIDSKEVLRRLKTDGWTVVRVKGSHHHLSHPVKLGIVTVKHPAKDFPSGRSRALKSSRV